MPERPRGRIMREVFPPARRGRAVVALGALASVAVAAGTILGAGLSGTSAGASPSVKSSGASTVQRRDLVQTDTEPGTLSYANPHTVFNRLSGTVTSLPSVGQTITPGQTLFKVSGAPVVLMTGGVPAYRNLSQGVSAGADVQELEQNLVALGFDPSHQITVDQTFDAATAAAVDRWQATLGETQTGSVSLGQVVFLPGSQRVTVLNAVLGSTGGSSSGSASGSGSSGGSSTSGSTASTPPAATRAVFVSLTTTTTTTTSTTAAATGTDPGPPGQKPPSGSAQSTTAASLAALVAILRAEIAELKKSRVTSTSPAGSGAGAASTGPATRSSGAGSSAGGSASAAGASVGGGGGSSAVSSAAAGASPSAQAIMQTTSTKLVVTVNLDATKQSEAVVGDQVTVQMPDGTTLDGKITGVSPVAVSSSSSSSSSSGSGSGGSSTPSATVPITITLRNSRHVMGLDQAAVSVNFQQQKARNVLSVPVSALLATAGGSYAVQQAGGAHGLIPVTPGLFAAGYVQISGAQIYPGLQVTDSQG